MQFSEAETLSIFSNTFFGRFDGFDGLDAPDIFGLFGNRNY